MRVKVCTMSEIGDFEDIEHIPANEPTAPVPGYPFEIFDDPA